MQFYNATQLEAGYAPGLLKSGRQCVVLAAKATYAIPASNQLAQLAKKRQPIAETDSFYGAPGESSPLLENDYAPLKHRCDVILLNPHAYAPDDQPVKSVEVALQLNQIDKRMRVVGPRTWERNMMVWRASDPEPFIKQAINYENAWGGCDFAGKEDYSCITDNPVGKGYFYIIDKGRLSGQSLPNTEPLNKRLLGPGDKLPPLAYGAIARNWTPRSGFGGTYNDAWIKDRRPLLPDDFDERYYQCAPEDQQTDFLHGGEQVMLHNLTRAGVTAFEIPKLAVPMQVIMRDGRRHNLDSKIDTLVINPEQGWFTLTWRARVGLRRSLHEIDTLIVGRPTPGWEHARVMDKPYWDLRRLNEIGAEFKRAKADEKRLREKKSQYTPEGDAV